MHVINSKEGWDQKVSEANKDGKIVSNLKSSTYLCTFITLTNMIIESSYTSSQHQILNDLLLLAFAHTSSQCKFAVLRLKFISCSML